MGGCCGGRVKAAAQQFVAKTKKAPVAAKKSVSSEAAPEQSAFQPPEPPLVPEATHTE